jgi:hypothetical protein
MDLVVIQACIQDRRPGITAVSNEEALGKCVEELTSAIQEATVASAPKFRPRADKLPLYPLVFRIKYA